MDGNVKLTIHFRSSLYCNYMVNSWECQPEAMLFYVDAGGFSSCDQALMNTIVTPYRKD